MTDQLPLLIYGYWDVANRFARHWPEDKAAQEITAWRAELDGEVA